MTNEGDVRITQREVYDKVVGLEDGLGRVEALLEKHIALEEQRSEGIEVRLENHGTRLGDLGSQHATLEGRVTKVESDIRSDQEALRVLQESLAKKESRKAPWWVVIGAIVGIVAAVGGSITIFTWMSNLSTALTHMP